MADIPNNPGGPARTAPPDVDLLNKGLKTMDELLRATVAGFTDLTDRLENMGDSMDHSAKGAKTVTGHLREQTSEFKKLAVFSSKLEEQMNGFYETQKKISQLKKGSTSFADMLATLKKMQEQSEQFMRSGLLDGKKLDAARKQYQAIGAQITKLSSKPPEEIMSTRGLNKVKGELSGILQECEAIAKSVKKVNLKGWQQDLRNADRAMSTLVGTSARMDKFTRYGQMGADILEARRLRSAGLNEQFHTKRAGLTERFNLTHKSSPEDFTKAGDEWNGGRGRLTGTILRRSMQEEASGKSRLSTRLGMAMVERGEGSALKGAVSMAGGFAESGASMAMGMVGKAAPILAVLDLMKDVFDKRMMMNSKVSEQLGQGGIYGAPGSDPSLTLRHINANLNTDPTGAGFQFGIGYEKNLSIAKAMVDGGMSVSNLASDYNSNDDQYGTKHSSFGTFQRNAQVWGRASGMNSDETTAQTIKLVSQYKQSLQGTEDFFKQINKDVQVAGLTTAKYIGILDDVNSHYDRSNKLLGTTVDVMNLLGRTGRLTAEDMKDMMDTITDGGKQRSLEVKSFLNLQSMSQKGGFTPKILGEQVDFDDAANQVKGAFGDSWDTNAFKDALKASEHGQDHRFLEYTSGLRQDADAKFGIKRDANGNPVLDSNKHTIQDRDNPQLQAANGAIQSLEQRFMRLSGTRQRAAQGGPQAAIGEATADTLFGPSFGTDRFGTFQALSAAMKIARINPSQLAMNPQSVFSSPVFLKAMEQVGLSPEKAKNYLPLEQAGAQAQIDVFKQGYVPGESADYKASRERSAEDTRSFLHNQGWTNIDMKKSAVESMKDYASTDAGARTLAALLPHMDDFFEKSLVGPLAKQLREVLKPQDVADQVAKATQIKADTTPMAEIFAAKFKELFLLISQPVEEIADALANWGIHKQGVASGKDNELLRGTVSRDLDPARSYAGKLRSALVADRDDYTTKHPNDAAGIALRQKRVTDAESDFNYMNQGAARLDSGARMTTWEQDKVRSIITAWALAERNKTPFQTTSPSGTHFGQKAHPLVDEQHVTAASAMPPVAKLAGDSRFFAPFEAPRAGRSVPVQTINHYHSLGLQYIEPLLGPAQSPLTQSNQDAKPHGGR